MGRIHPRHAYVSGTSALDFDGCGFDSGPTAAGVSPLVIQFPSQNQPMTFAQEVSFMKEALGNRKSFGFHEARSMPECARGEVSVLQLVVGLAVAFAVGAALILL